MILMNNTKTLSEERKMFNPDMTPEEIATKENYYWQVWKAH